MKAMPILAAAAMLAAATPTRAQSGDSYSAGYDAGYTDTYPATGMPNPDSDYGRGFQQGQDDADADDETQRRALESSEPEPATPYLQHEDGMNSNRGQFDPDPGDTDNDK